MIRMNKNAGTFLFSTGTPCLVFHPQHEITFYSQKIYITQRKYLYIGIVSTAGLTFPAKMGMGSSYYYPSKQKWRFEQAKIVYKGPYLNADFLRNKMKLASFNCESM